MGVFAGGTLRCCENGWIWCGILSENIVARAGRTVPLTGVEISFVQSVV